MTRVTIYEVDPVIDLYRKVTANDYATLSKRYVALTKQQRFRKAFPRFHSAGLGLPRLVKSHGGGSYASYTHHEIRLGSNRTEAVLLHEIAHIVARKHPQYGYCPDHGPGFAAALLDVVRVALGTEAERSLRHTYRALRIRVYSAAHPKGVLPRVKLGTAPEKAQPLIDKMLAYREAAKRERGAMRRMIAQMEDPTQTGEVEMPCPICEGPATLNVWFDARWGTRGTNGLDYHGRCADRAGCGFDEYSRIAGQAYRALRAAHRKVA